MTAPSPRILLNLLMGKDKSRRDPEYRLILTPCLYEREQAYKTRIAIETVKQFASFQYDLAVEDHATPAKIHFRILGLRTPKLSLPASGPARFQKEYDVPGRTVEIAVEGLDKIVHLLTVGVSPKEIRIIKQPADNPVEIVVNKFSTIVS